MVDSVLTTVRLDLLAPLSGLMVPLASVPDPVFAGKLVGDGIAIDPTSCELLAPMAGTVTQLHSAHHALAITSSAGLEVLLHVGLDTVMLKGEGFSPKVALGDRVAAGQTVLTFDPVLVGRKARSLLTLMIVTNGDQVESMTPASGLVTAGKDLALHLVLKESAAPGLPGQAAAGGPDPGRPDAGGALRSRLVSLPNPFGLHARPAAVLADAAKKFGGTIRLVRGAQEVNAKSVVAILGFETKAGDALQISATGPDAREATLALADLLAAGCGEPAGAAAAPPAAVASAPKAAKAGARELAGVSAAPGMAVGRIFQFRPKPMTVVETASNPAQERAHLEAALQDAGLQIEAIKGRLALPADPVRVGILSAHQELLLDPELTGFAYARIDAGKSAAFAWREAYHQEADKLGALESDLLRERANDLRDIGHRVLALLTGKAESRLEVPPDSILVVEELSPSSAAQMDPGNVLGLCTTTGGPNGHVAILARSLGIPAICAIDGAVLDLPAGTTVVVDGTQGILHLEPSEADLDQARQGIERQAARQAGEKLAAQKPALSADGFRLQIGANISNAADARSAVLAGAEGVGLLRSEFLFHDRQTAPTETEQAEAYSAVAKALGPGRKLVVRTLDVGGDKPLAYLPMPREGNPFLGLRGVRVSLDRPDLFRIQLRALLQAAPLCDLHVMFPMVALLEELRAAKRILAEEAAALGQTAKVGIMVEVPSAVLIADALAREVDFFSIGTNDLTQYCLAMDRGNPKLAKAADALHPGVLKLIALTVESAHRHGKWVGICGGLASDVLALPALLGLGVDELSVSIPAIGAIKSRLSHLHKPRCETLARGLLELATAGEVRERLATFVQ